MHAARGFGGQTGDITLAGEASPRVDPSRFGRCALDVTLLGKQMAQRIRQVDPADVMVLRSRSRARHTLPASIASQPAVVQRILEIRVEPPENLQRVPGPEAILRLRQAGCIAQDRQRKPRPLGQR
jgi:hypothetical protein